MTWLKNENISYDKAIHPSIPFKITSYKVKIQDEITFFPTLFTVILMFLIENLSSLLDNGLSQWAVTSLRCITDSLDDVCVFEFSLNSSASRNVYIQTSVTSSDYVENRYFTVHMEDTKYMKHVWSTWILKVDATISGKYCKPSGM